MLWELQCEVHAQVGYHARRRPADDEIIWNHSHHRYQSRIQNRKCQSTFLFGALHDDEGERMTTRAHLGRDIKRPVRVIRRCWDC